MRRVAPRSWAVVALVLAVVLAGVLAAVVTQVVRGHDGTAPGTAAPSSSVPSSSAPSSSSPSSSAPASGEPATGWRRLPDLPLPPRWGSFATWVGDQLVVLGGDSRRYVGGPVPLADLRDGAAFDPETSRWQSIAPAPVAVGEGDPSVVADDALVLVYQHAWLRYDLDDDAWRRLPRPPTAVDQPTMAVDRGHLYVIDRYVSESGGETVQVLDLRTGTWTPLPPSPFRPSLDDRTLVATPEGLVVVGDDLHPRQAGRHHEDAHAELWDGSAWTRYPDSAVQGCCWHWTGERIVSTYRVTRHDSRRGGLHEFRAGALDPATREWSALPWLPRHRSALLDAAGWPLADGPLVFSEGYLYDDVTRSSVAVPAPTGGIGGPALALGRGTLVQVGGYRVSQARPWGSRVVPTAEVWVLDAG